MQKWKDWLRQEERFRAQEQDAIIKAALSASKSSLSQLRRSGFALTGLSIESKRSAFAGKVVLELKSRLDAEFTGWRAGEPVRLLTSGAVAGAGVVERTPRDGLICVSFREEPLAADGNELTGTVSLIKMLDDTLTFGRMHANLDKFISEPDNSINSLILTSISNWQSSRGILCNPSSTTVSDSTLSTVMTLNKEQVEAVQSCLDERNRIGLIHGPPGTGKTQTLVELLLQFSRLGKKILVCGPSNLSVDNVLERFLKHQPQKRIIRLGHAARMLEAVCDYSLDVVAAKSDAGKLLADVKNEMDQILSVQLPRCKSGAERRACYAELKQLRVERREREGALALQLLAEADVVFATLGTASGLKLMKDLPKFDGKRGVFDVVIVDEAGQALLPECLGAALLAKEKLVLAGDHFQLPPTVMDASLNATLGVSLFEQLMHSLPNSVMLKEQHRMNKSIMAWSNEKFYGGQLRAHASVADWCIEGEEPVVFVDTAGFGLLETSASEQQGDGIKSLLVAEESKLNEGEAELALKHAQHLIKQYNLEAHQIAIISPYSAQVSHLRATCSLDGLEIGSIDGFQGREKDAVILSLVRSNDDGEVGFLAEMRRLNVAMTRAKKHLYIIGDSSTLERDPDLKQLVR